MKVIKDGRVVEIPDAEVGKRYLAGEIRLPATGDIPVAIPGQGIRRIAPQLAETAFAAGARAVSREEEHRAYLEENKSAGTFLQGLAFGALRGASLGLSDPIIKAISPEAGAHIADIREQHPYASLAGEAVPLVASMFASGGATAPEAAGALAAARGAGVAEGAAGAARGAMSAERLIGAGGQVAERSLARSALPSAVTSGREAEAVASATRAAQESPGAAKAALNAFTFAPRKVAELGQWAERTVADVVGRGSTNFAARLGQQALSKGAGTAAEGALFSVGHTVSEASLGDHDLTAEKLMSSALHGALLGGAVGAGFGAFGEAAGTGAKAILKKMNIGAKAEEQAFLAFQPTSKMREAASKVKGGEAAVGRTALDRDLVQGTAEARAAATAADRAKLGTKLGELMDTVDAAAAPSAKPQVAKLHKEILEIAEPLSKMPGQEALTRDILNYADSFFSKAAGDGVPGGQVGLKRLWEIRKTLDRNIDKLSTPQVKHVWGQVRNVLDDEIARTGEEVAQKIGAGFAKDYKEIKTAYQHVAILDKAAQKAVLKAPSGFASGLSGLGMGLGAGVAFSSGPAGLATGLAVKLAHSAIKERGRATIATVFDKLAAYAGLRKAVVHVDHQVDDAIARLVGSDRPAKRLRLPKTSHPFEDTDDRYDKASKSVARAAADPQGFKRHVDAYLAPIDAHAPETAKSMRSTAARTVTYLASKLPKGRVDMQSLTPHLDVSDASDHDKATFLRYVDGATNYPKVLKELAKGQLTKEHVEAMQAVNPKALDDLRSKAMRALASKTTPVPYEHRVSLSLLLDVPGDITMTPKFVLSMQKQYAMPKPPKQSSPGRGGGGSKGGQSIAPLFSPR